MRRLGRILAGTSHGFELSKDYCDCYSFTLSSLAMPSDLSFGWEASIINVPELSDRGSWRSVFNWPLIVMVGFLDLVSVFLGESYLDSYTGGDFCFFASRSSLLYISSKSKCALV